MADLSAFPITRRWPAQHPDRIQLYSLTTPNGVKVSIMLEEIGLAYEPHRVDFGQNESWTPEFLSLNPNGKIPAILDPERPGRRAAGAVRIRRDPDLSRREDRQVPGEGRRRALRDHPVGDVPDGRHRADVRPGRLLPQIRGARTTRTSARATAMSTNRSACSACSRTGWRAATGSWARTTPSPTSRRSGWVRNLIGFYDAGDLVGYGALKRVPAWLERGLARPAVQRGLTIPARG